MAFQTTNMTKVTFTLYTVESRTHEEFCKSVRRFITEMGNFTASLKLKLPFVLTKPIEATSREAHLWFITTIKHDKVNEIIMNPLMDCGLMIRENAFLRDVRIITIEHDQVHELVMDPLINYGYMIREKVTSSQCTH